MAGQLIDVTTTAVLRKDLVDQTLRTFSKNLFSPHRCRLILNVDAVGNDGETVEDIHAVGRRYFDDVLLLTQERPNQNFAVKNCWSHVETEFFFNLEDDWEMVHRLDLLDMIDIMRREPRLAALRLPKGPSGDTWCQVFKNPLRKYWYRWNGRYFEIPPRSVVIGHWTGMPSLCRTEWMRPMLEEILPNVSVEHMCIGLHKKKNPKSYGWKYGAYTERNVKLTAIERGKEWRKKSPFVQDDTHNPSTWVRKQ